VKIRQIPCGRADLKGTTNLMVAFRNFTNAPKNVSSVFPES